MAQTPQYNNFTTQPLNPLAQQTSQEQFALEAEFDEIPEAFTPNTVARYLNKKKLTRIVAIILFLHFVSFFSSSGIHPHQQIRLK